MTSDEGLHDFEISAEEMTLLQQLGVAYEKLASVVNRAVAKPRGKYTVTMGRIEAEIVRDSLTEAIARTGFDDDYAPTIHGKMLEELIDRFYTT